MEKRLLTEAERLLDSRHQSKRRTLVIRGLALLVVLATISALIMPAITMSTEVECGLEEHHHTEECYAAQQVPPQPVMVCTEGQSGETVIHSHDGLCYDSQGNLICTLPEVEAHTHGPDCYQEHRTLTCQEPVDPGHQHSAACYSYVKVESAAADMAAPAAASEYICGMQEGEGAHRHTEECYPEERAAEPVCGREESEDEYDEAGNLVRQGHRHTEECWMVRVREKLVCGQEESEDEYDGEGNLIRQGHHHDGSCWLQGDELCFQYGCRQHESAGHQHTDACVQAVAQESIRVDAQGEQWEQTLVCQEQEREPGHVHTDECYEITQVLACRLPELEAHTHGGECYDENGALICQKPEVKAHQHTEACFSTPEGGPVETQVLICGKEEHTHTDECRMNLPAETEKFYCGMAEHLHSKEKDCYFPSGELKCTLPEHTHTDECTVPPSERPQMSDPVELEVDRTFEWEAAPYRMTIRVTGTAVIPGQPVMVVEEPEVPMADQPLLSGFLSLFTSFLSTASATDVEIDEPEAGAAAPEPTAAVDGSQGAYEPEPYSQEEGIVDAGQEPGGSSDAEDGVEIQPAGAPDPGRIEFSMEKVGEWDADYQRMAERAEASGEPVEELSVFRVTAVLDGVKLDLSRCEIRVEAELIEAEPQEPDTLPGGEDQVWNGGDGVSDQPSEDAGEDITRDAQEDFADDLPDEDGTPAQMSWVQHTVKKARAMSASFDYEDSAEEEDSAEDETSSESEADAVKTQTQTEGNVTAVYQTTGNGANPKFTVEYYAWLQVPERSEFKGDIHDDVRFPVDSSHTKPSGYDKLENGLPFLDTSVTGTTPVNGPSSADHKVLLTLENGYVKMKSDEKSDESELTQIFAPSELEYDTEDQPTTDKLNRVENDPRFQNKDGSHYKLAKVEVTQIDGITQEYTQNLDALQYYNNLESIDTAVGIQDGTKIRLVYETTSGDESYAATLFDYDISGKDENGKVTTKENGINSPENYSDTEEVKFAFGNSNTGTNFGKVQWEKNNLKNNLNMSNSSERINYEGKWAKNDPEGAGSYRGCTFGLVTGIKTNGDLQYAKGIAAPNLFGGGVVTGRQVYNNHKLVFDRQGDTYTLKMVRDENGIDINTKDLQKFEHPTAGGTTYKHIWTNNFWPMDGKKDLQDPQFGENGVAIKIDNASMPPSDDGLAHNCYFGMKFAVDFKIPESYMGPLEYYFYGDDDMWVFLDKVDESGNLVSRQLVCDIGGVHSSVGEYVDLWKYVEHTRDSEGNPVGPADDGTHYTLRFFYTERGASGSTCWMQFTLPNLVSVPTFTPAPKNKSLEVTKEVVQSDSPGWEMYKNKYFVFELTLSGWGDTDANYYDITTSSGADIKISKSNPTVRFALKANETAYVSGLPKALNYSVKEIGMTENPDKLADGEIAPLPDDTIVKFNGEAKATGEGTTGSNVKVICSNDFSKVGQYQLPETGGGTRAQWYTLACAPFLAAGCLWYKKKSQGEGGGG